MVSIPSALMLLVVALFGATGTASAAWSPVRAHEAGTRTAQALRVRDAAPNAAPDAAPDAGWEHAVRAGAVKAARSSVGKRDGNPDRRDRTASVDPAWAPLVGTAAHASRSADVVLRSRASALRAPGLPAPSSRAPPAL